MSEPRSLNDEFNLALTSIIEQIGKKGQILESDGPVSVSLRVNLTGVGEIAAHISKDAAKGHDQVPLNIQFDLPDAGSRVQRAKMLLANGGTYSQGCSGFVCGVLQIPWESANNLMGSDPPLVGDNNTYDGLQPGDIAGWISDSRGAVTWQFTLERDQGCHL